MIDTPGNFFDRQAESLRRSRQVAFLFWLFAAIVSGCVAFVTGIILRLIAREEDIEALRDPKGAMLAAAAVTFLLLLFGCWRRHRQIRAGVASFLRLYDIREVDPDSMEEVERRAHNLCAEMALASGVPLPQLYLLENQAINAFCIGWEVEQATLVLSRGALDRLTREELQGVIAHEFSHILYGDMRLNTRMLVWLAGLFMIFQAGAVLCVGVPSEGGGTSGRSGPTGRHPGLFALGLVLMGIGYFGNLLGKILQCLFSRNREIMADASAVQFTRNPLGITGALKKLGKENLRARLGHRIFEEFGHMLFADTKLHFVSRALATHPPLEERIRWLDPGWDGVFPKVPRREGSFSEHIHTGNHPLPPVRKMRDLYENVGTPDDDEVAWMHLWLEALPEAVIALSRKRDGAAAIVLRIFLQNEPDTLNDQLAALEDFGDADFRETVQTVRGLLPDLRSADLLPLFDLCVPALRRMYGQQREAYLDLIDRLVDADGQVSLQEYALQMMVRQALASEAEIRSLRRPRCSVGQCGEALNLFLSLLAWDGAQTPAQAEESFQAAANRFRGYQGPVTLALRQSVHEHYAELDQILRQLMRLTPGVQKQLIAAAREAVKVNGRIDENQMLTFRAAAAAMHVPVSPLLMRESTIERPLGASLGRQGPGRRTACRRAARFCPRGCRW